MCHFSPFTTNLIMPLASIQSILSVENHNNADSLDVVKVLGYHCIVKRDQWKPDDLCVFIEPDSVLPDAPWADFYRAKSNRVKAIRLRGVWSMGIVESLQNVGITSFVEEILGSPVSALKPGSDVTSFLGVTKYEPPAPQDLSASGPYGFGIPKTDETRYQSIEPSQMPPWGTLVDVTLKIDGQSWSAVCKLNLIEDYPDDLMGSPYTAECAVGGRSFLYKPDCDNAYTRNERRYNVLGKLEAFCRANHASLALRGESYGSGIQKGGHNPHSKVPADLALFSTWLIDERRYATKGHPFYIHTIAPILGLPTVPVLQKDVPLTPELISHYDEGIETIDGKPFEGVVIQHPGGSFKVINKAYDSKK